MSEFIAEAQVLITPNTTTFRAALQAELAAAAKGVVVPVAIVPTTAGVGGAASATAALSEAQKKAVVSTVDLAAAARLENTVLGRQAVELPIVTAETLAKAGADATATAAARAHAAAMNSVSKAAVANAASMAGLRGATLTAEKGFIATTVALTALGFAVKGFIDFQRELNVFSVTAGATAEQMKAVSDEARALGRDITLPGVAANDAAAALTELSKAGLSVQEALAAARGTLQLATAAQIDNAQAAELVANSLNAFQLEGTKATKVADLLAGAANASQGSISDMGLALKQAAAVARLTGLTVEETVTLLTELARAGLSASDAGTSLRTTLLRLVGDFPKVAKEVERLGLDLRDVNGNIRPEFFSELGEKLRKMAPAARQASVAILGGSDAIRAFGILSRSSAEDFDALLAKISEAGSAQELAAAQTEGLGGDVEAAKNQFADLGLTVGQVASGPLGLFVRTAGAAAGAVNEMNQRVGESAGGQGFFSTFGDVLDGLQDSFSDLNISFQQGVRNAQDQVKAFSTLDAVAQSTTSAVNALADALERAGRATLAKQGLPDSGLNVKQVLNRVVGFDAEEVRARISGDNASLLSVLQAEQDFLLEQLNRQFVKNRPALRRALENALLGVTNDVSSISKQGAADAKSAAADAARAIKEADAALLDALGQRREDAQRRITTAGDTAGLQDDIRRQDQFQALIKVQIQKIRARIKDEQTRKEAIRALRIALIESRKAEEELRQEQIQNAQERRDDIQNLNIQIAEARGNDAALEKAIQARINTLNKQIKAAKGDALKMKQLILERERLKEQLRELNKKEKENQKSAQELFFTFLQTQQGFAANLLGNLIPGFATGGLVGNTSPQGQGPQDVGAGVQQAGTLRAAETRGVRPVQVDRTNQLLQQILAALQGRHTQPPEIRNNRAEGHAMFDIF